MSQQSWAGPELGSWKALKAVRTKRKIAKLQPWRQGRKRLAEVGQPVAPIVTSAPPASGPQISHRAPRTRAAARHTVTSRSLRLSPPPRRLVGRSTQVAKNIAKTAVSEYPIQQPFPSPSHKDDPLKLYTTSRLAHEGGMTMGVTRIGEDSTLGSGELGWKVGRRGSREILPKEKHQTVALGTIGETLLDDKCLIGNTATRLREYGPSRSLQVAVGFLRGARKALAGSATVMACQHPDDAVLAALTVMRAVTRCDQLCYVRVLRPFVERELCVSSGQHETKSAGSVSMSAMSFICGCAKKPCAAMRDTQLVENVMRSKTSVVVKKATLGCSKLAVPVWHAREIVGILVATRSNSPLNQMDEFLATHIASSLSVALRRGRTTVGTQTSMDGPAFYRMQAEGGVVRTLQRRFLDLRGRIEFHPETSYSDVVEELAHRTRCSTQSLAKSVLAAKIALVYIPDSSIIPQPRVEPQVSMEWPCWWTILETAGQLCGREGPSGASMAASTLTTQCARRAGVGDQAASLWIGPPAPHSKGSLQTVAAAVATTRHAICVPRFHAEQLCSMECICRVYGRGELAIDQLVNMTNRGCVAVPLAFEHEVGGADGPHYGVLMAANKIDEEDFDSADVDRLGVVAAMAATGIASIHRFARDAALLGEAMVDQTTISNAFGARQNWGAALLERMWPLALIKKPLVECLGEAMMIGKELLRSELCLIFVGSAIDCEIWNGLGAISKAQITPLQISSLRCWLPSGDGSSFSCITVDSCSGLFARGRQQGLVERDLQTAGDYDPAVDCRRSHLNSPFIDRNRMLVPVESPGGDTVMGVVEVTNFSGEWESSELMVRGKAFARHVAACLVGSMSPTRMLQRRQTWRGNHVRSVQSNLTTFLQDISRSTAAQDLRLGDTDTASDSSSDEDCCETLSSSKYESPSLLCNPGIWIALSRGADCGVFFRPTGALHYESLAREGPTNAFSRVPQVRSWIGETKRDKVRVVASLPGGDLVVFIRRDGTAECFTDQEVAFLSTFGSLARREKIMLKEAHQTTRRLDLMERAFMLPLMVNYDARDLKLVSSCRILMGVLSSWRVSITKFESPMLWRGGTWELTGEKDPVEMYDVDIKDEDARAAIQDDDEIAPGASELRRIMRAPRGYCTIAREQSSSEAHGRVVIQPMVGARNNMALGAIRVVRAPSAGALQAWEATILQLAALQIGASITVECEGVLKEGLREIGGGPRSSEHDESEAGGKGDGGAESPQEREEEFSTNRFGQKQSTAETLRERNARRKVRRPAKTGATLWNTLREQTVRQNTAMDKLTILAAQEKARIEREKEAAAKALTRQMSWRLPLTLGSQTLRRRSSLQPVSTLRRRSSLQPISATPTTPRAMQPVAPTRRRASIVASPLVQSRASRSVFTGPQNGTLLE